LFSCSDEEKIVNVYKSNGITDSYEDFYGFGTILEVQTDTNVMMPLNIGNNWKYEFYMCLYSGETIESYFEYIKVVDVEYINGEKWYKILDSTDYGLHKYYYYTNTTTGLYCKLTRESEPVLMCPNINIYNMGDYKLKQVNIRADKAIVPIFNNDNKVIDFEMIGLNIDYGIHIRQENNVNIWTQFNPNVTFPPKRVYYADFTQLQCYSGSTSTHEITKMESYSKGIGFIGADYLDPALTLISMMRKNLVDINLTPKSARIEEFNGEWK
jgi:hypothetical protein